MDKFNTRPRDFKPSDIPSYVSNEKHILLELVSSLQDLENEGKIKLKDSLKSKYKEFEQNLESHLLKKLIQESIGSYDAGNFTIAEIKRQNFMINKREEEQKRKRYGPTYQTSKLEHQLQQSPQGKCTIFSYASKEIITCRFESLITKELFNNAIINYHFQGKSEPLPVQSLFEHIRFAKQFGINIEDLPKVLNVYAETCSKPLAGQLRLDANSLVETTHMIIENLSLKTEKRKVQTNLSNLKRTPQMEIQAIYGDLYNSYRILFEY